MGLKEELEVELEVELDHLAITDHKPLYILENRETYTLEVAAAVAELCPALVEQVDQDLVPTVKAAVQAAAVALYKIIALGVVAAVLVLVVATAVRRQTQQVAVAGGVQVAAQAPSAQALHAPAVLAAKQLH